MQTLARFIKEAQPLRMHVKRLVERPEHEPTEWDHTARHWECTLQTNKKHMTVYFSQGSAHTEAPTLANVLDSLVLDVTAKDQSFEDWASEYGYDPDSRKAYRIYTQCLAHAEQLESLLGTSLFNRLVNETERL